MMKKVCVFCGSSLGNDERFKNAAKEIADFFVKNNLTLVYGGADVGLMKILADIMLKNNKEVIGIMPHALIEKEVAHKGLNNFIVAESMSERKQKMIDISDAFIALPGGFGTLDEIFEVMTLNQLRINDKPMGILNTIGYYDFLLSFIDKAVDSGFIRPEYRDNIIVSENVNDLMKRMKDYKPLSMTKWIKDIKKESNL